MDFLKAAFSLAACLVAHADVQVHVALANGGTITAELRQDVYVWQRNWNEAVEATVRARGTNFHTLVPLVAEVSWKQGEPEVARTSIPLQALAQAGCKVGLALRIGPFSGPFTEQDSRTAWLAGLGAFLLAEARSNGLSVVELQLDFDCAESKLSGYQVWVEAIRRRVKPTPVVITALPSWLKRPEFGRLARAADGFVLQVHSLERPRGVEAPFRLCDPAAARRAVTDAARSGVPFRVALPTYGYLVAFGRDGKFIGLSAEGPARTWPAGVQLREVRADAAAMAGLVSEWRTNRPTVLGGVIWYRLPVPGDERNWRWPTLASVMSGKPPASALRAVAQRPNRGLVEIELRNEGSLDESRLITVVLQWKSGRLIASDGLSGFEVIPGKGNTLRFASPQTGLPAGAARPIGWARFDDEHEVELNVETR